MKIGTSSISDLPAVYFDGAYRVLAAIPSPPEALASFPKFGELMTAAPMDPSQWREIDLAWYGNPIWDQGMTSSCFPSGTRIRMADGSQKPIETVSLLDKVLTAERRHGKVTKLFVRNETSHLVRLCLWGHNHLRMTEEHPVLTKRGYVKVVDLTSNDWVAIPRYSPNQVSVIKTADHVERITRRVGKRVMGGVPGRKMAIVVYSAVPDFIDLTPGVGPRIRYPEPAATGVKNRLPRWDMEFSNFNKDTDRSQIDDSYVWRKVRGVSCEDFSGPVFNMEVEGDNSYVAEGVGVHNCVGHSTTAGMQVVLKQMGRPALEFNPFFVYAFVNNGRDAGAMISDALRSLQQNGTCLKDDLPVRQVYFENNLPAQAVENAKRFRLNMAYHCQSYEEICSAITLGFACPLGIYVDQNFVNLDSEGVAGTPNGSQGGGHAILGVGLKRSARYGWLIKIQNSWGLRYGMQGHAYIHKGHFQRMMPDAFAIQALMEDPQDVNKPEDVPVLTFTGGQVSRSDTLTASAVEMGFDKDWVLQVLAQYGPDVLLAVVEAARQGLSVATVVDLLTKFGPKILDLFIAILNKMKMMGVTAVGVADSEVVPGDVIQGVDSAVIDVIVEKWLPVIIQKYLPMVLEKYGPQIIQFVIDYLLKSLNK